MELHNLSDDCLIDVYASTSPLDACRSCLVSTAVKSIAECDALWEKFLPSNYQEIMSRLVSPLEFHSKKDLYFKLCSPLPIDGSNMVFSLEKSSGKMCYILSARELDITWSTNPLYWSWKPLLGSRFEEVAELRTVWWLEIKGKINTRMLSPNTTYEAHLIVKIADRAYGLDYAPSEVSVKIGIHEIKGTIYLRRNEGKKVIVKHEIFFNRVRSLRTRILDWDQKEIHEIGDGWIEICLGEFYNDGGCEEVTMGLREPGVHLKGGLIVEGLSIRPKKREVQISRVLKSLETKPKDHVKTSRMY